MVTIYFKNGQLFTKDGQRFEVDRVEAESIEIKEDRSIKDMLGKTLTGGRNHAEGIYSVATGGYSHAEGVNSYITGGRYPTKQDIDSYKILNGTAIIQNLMASLDESSTHLKDAYIEAAKGIEIPKGIDIEIKKEVFEPYPITEKNYKEMEDWCRKKGYMEEEDIVDKLCEVGEVYPITSEEVKEALSLAQEKVGIDWDSFFSISKEEYDKINWNDI